MYSVWFENGENEYSLYMGSGESSRLKEGEKYVITYGKRTRRIVDIEVAEE